MRWLVWVGLGLALVVNSAGQNYVSELGAGPPSWPTASVARGASEYANGPCIGCHTIEGISTGNKGANLTHEGSHRDPEWLRNELLNPTSPRPPIDPDQIDDLVAYLSTLK